MSGRYVIDSILILLIVVLLVITVYVNRNFANIKGRYGERVVNKILSQLSEGEYKIYDDMYIPTENNKTTQVDHVVTSPYGIFVIETKHYDGCLISFSTAKSILGDCDVFIKNLPNIELI